MRRRTETPAMRPRHANSLLLLLLLLHVTERPQTDRIPLGLQLSITTVTLEPMIITFRQLWRKDLYVMSSLNKSSAYRTVSFCFLSRSPLQLR